MRKLFITSFLLLAVTSLTAQKNHNPIAKGWYADPEGVVFNNEYWVYPTTSVPYRETLHFDAFSSKDLIHWTKHENVLTSNEITWAWQSMWAPSVVENNGKYYFFFGANDMHAGEPGGIGVAVADNPAGPFKDLLGRPLVDQIINGAQPIDQFAYRDSDGKWYLIYGGWGHCNICCLADDFKSIVPFPDGTMFREMTPSGYVEGPFVLKRNGKYYFMWSEGTWNGPDYRVAYAMANNIFGPWKREGTILEQDPNVGTGAGHHSVIKTPKGEYYIVYHRHPLGDTNGNHRMVCIDKLNFSKDGKILPVKMTN